MPQETENIIEFEMLLDRYFKQYFAGKDITKAADEVLMKTLKRLTLCYIDFRLFYYSLCRVKQDKALWKNLDKRSKRQLNIIIKGIDCIGQEIYSILLPISEGAAGKKFSSEVRSKNSF